MHHFSRFNVLHGLMLRIAAGIKSWKLPHECSRLLYSNSSHSSIVSASKIKNDPFPRRRRPPIVTIMGHVDHGKTTLLDWLRRSRVAAGEAGGITQHIGAFSVQVRGGGGGGGEERITFLDTPGHAAFSAIRERGTRVTDLVVLVVAAEDGVMAQTVEAIELVKAYQSPPLILAINKCDRPGWQQHRPRIHAEMARYGLVVEEMGGEVQSVPISALTGWNVEGPGGLLDAILAQAEMLESLGGGTDVGGMILEVHHRPGLGDTASMIVQTGTLRPGAILVANEAICRVRGIRDCQGATVTEAGPSSPVETLGWRGLPAAGSTFQEVASEREAHRMVQERIRIRQEQEALEALDQAAQRERLDQKLLQLARRGTSRATTSTTTNAVPEPPRSVYYYEEVVGAKGSAAPELKIVLKCDVTGSVEAIRKALEEQLPRKKAIATVIHAGIGPVTESDLELARSAGSNGIIVAFNTGIDSAAAAKQTRKPSCSNNQSPPVISHRIIYGLIDEIRSRLASLLPPIWEERVVGRASILQLFPIDGGRGVIAGCRVDEGTVGVSKDPVGTLVRIQRNGVVIGFGRVKSIRHGKHEIASASKGMECGIGLENANSHAQQGSSNIDPQFDSNTNCNISQLIQPGDQILYIQRQSKPDTID